MSDSNLNNENSDFNQNIPKKFPKIELTTTSFDHYTLNKTINKENDDKKNESDITKLQDLFKDPKMETKERGSNQYSPIKNRRNSTLRIPNKDNSVTKSMDFLSINTKTNHFQAKTIPLKEEVSSTPLKNGFSKSQPNMIKEEEEPVNLQNHISKMFNHAFTDAIYSPRESWLASVFNIYHAIILYISVFLECYSTQLMVQETETQRLAWRLVSLIFTVQLCLYFLADVVLYPIRRRRNLAIIEATSLKNEKGEVINYKDIKVTKNPFKLYKGFIDFPHTMEFLGCLPFFIEEIFPKCRLININHYGIISFLLLCCRFYTCLSIFYYLRNRISKFFHIIIRATKESIYEIFSVIVLYFIVMIFCSRIIFYADLSKCSLDEETLNWKRYNNAKDINNSTSCELQSNLDAFWYTFMTMTTLGFGDQVVNTYFGKIMATLAFGATPILYTLPSIVITTKMITLIIHDTKSSATKDVAKKHKNRFFNMTQFLLGGNNRKNKFKLMKSNNENKNEDKEINIDDDAENKNTKKDKKLKIKNKNKSKKNKQDKENEKHEEKVIKDNSHIKPNDKDAGKYIVPLHNDDTGKSKDSKKKANLLPIPENKKKESPKTSSIAPLINTSFDKDSNSNPSTNNSNSNRGDEEVSNESLSEDIKKVVEDGGKSNNVFKEIGKKKLYESPVIKEEETPNLVESPKHFGSSDIKKSIIDQKSDLFSSSNLTSSTTIKKFYQTNTSSVGKPLASIFEDPVSGSLYDNEDIHPPTSPSASTSISNVAKSSSDVVKSNTKTTTFKTLTVPTSAGSGSSYNNETENENTIFDYNAYKKNANNKNYILGMLKQHYQTCLDEIDYVKKREKTLNSLKSGFEKGIMALQTM